MDGSYERETIQFAVKGPIPIKGDDEIDLSGVSAIEVTLDVPTTVGELVFRNYYTATVAVLILPGKTARALEKCERKRPWVCSITQKVLMPNPHLETGSHDIFSITPSESCVPWNNISVMRLILRQPSPLWQTFKIEEINLYKDLPRINNPPSTDARELDKILSVLKKQTVSALNCQSNQNNAATSPTNNDLQCSSPGLSQVTESPAGGYEIHRLPFV